MRILSAVLCLAIAATAAAEPPRPIAANLLFLPGHFVAGTQPDGNTLIWQGEHGLVVMDTGRHVAHTQAILDFAEAHKLPVQAIINSHWHLDHVGGNAMLRARYPAAEVYASNAVDHALTRFLAKYGKQLQSALADPDTDPKQAQAYRDELALLAKPEALLPTHPVTATQALTIDGHALQLHLESHAATAGDVWVLDPDAGVLASGDLVTLPAPLLDTACPLQWQTALGHLAETDFRTLVPGHGAPMSKAQFLEYRTAYDHLLACAAADKSTAECTDAWIADTREFIPSTDTPLTRDLLGFYLDHNLKTANLARYCSE